METWHRPGGISSVAPDDESRNRVNVADTGLITPSWLIAVSPVIVNAAENGEVSPATTVLRAVDELVGIFSIYAVRVLSGSLSDEAKRTLVSL